MQPTEALHWLVSVEFIVVGLQVTVTEVILPLTTLLLSLLLPPQAATTSKLNTAVVIPSVRI